MPIGDTLVGGNYLSNIKQWHQFDAKSESELATIQSEKLRALLNYAVSHVSYYNDLNISENSSDSEILQSFPMLTKTILRDEIDTLISNEYDINSLDKNHSSGSSGVQSFTYMTKDHKFYLRALQTHWWKWSGYRIGDPLLQFGISQKRTFIKKLKDFFYRCTYIKAFGLSEQELKALAKRINGSTNLFIAGYPSVINELAKVSLSNTYSSKVKGVICFGDKLFDHHIKNIISAFGDNVRIVDTYGCAEGLLMACKYDLDYYYIMSPHVYLEIVDDNGNAVKDGEMGHVLVTCLSNYAMPIIRYKLGDLAIKLPKDAYPKNRLLQYPLLQKIIGRETDIVKTTKGITLNVHSFTGILEYYSEIKQYKIIQNDLEHIIIEYIVDYNYDFNPKILEDIKNKFAMLTKNSLVIIFKEVNEIRPTASGKPQIIESNLKTA